MELILLFLVLIKNSSLLQFDGGVLSVDNSKEKELQFWNGLPPLVQKIHHRESILVTSLGVSISQAVGERENPFDWLKEKLPDNHLVKIPAAIKPTRSDFGVFRLGKQVLPKNANLVL